MAIELTTSINYSTNKSINKPVSDTPRETVSALSDMDVKKVSPNIVEKPVTHPIASETEKSHATEPGHVIELSPEKLDVVVSKLNDYVEQQKRDIRFSIDKDTDKTVIHLLDSKGNVLKQIPSEEVLAILRGIENNKGLFLEEDV